MCTRFVVENLVMSILNGEDRHFAMDLLKQEISTVDTNELVCFFGEKNQNKDSRLNLKIRVSSEKYEMWLKFIKTAYFSGTTD